jgi:uncharacterized protein (DUF1778 family)
MGMAKRMNVGSKKSAKKNSRSKSEKTASGQGRYAPKESERFVAEEPVVTYLGAAEAKRETKTARIELRFSVQLQEMMEKASSILGFKNASEYMRHVIQENSSKVIREQAILEVAEQDRQRVMDEINHPSAPGKDFAAAAEFYRKTFKV